MVKNIPDVDGDVRYPLVKVKLTGSDGNAFSIIGKVKDALRKAKVEQEEISRFVNEAMGGDYNNVLCTCMNWVSVS